MKILAPAVLLTLVLSGCATVSREAPPAQPLVQVPLAQTTAVGGSLYAASGSLALFEDLRARDVGDILSITLAERTNASKTASTTTSKNSDASVGNPTLFGRPLTRGGTPLFAGSMSTENDFEGDGSSSQSNSLDGTIAVTVVGKTPNGDLMVQGEKWLSLNQGREFIRVSGIVRAVDVQPDNTVPSYKLANARIDYGGKGALADANRMGLLARFFNSPWMPF